MAELDRWKIIAEEALLNDPIYQALRPIVVGLIERLRESSSPEAFVMLHRALLIEFAGRQDAASELLPLARDKARERLRALVERTPKPIDEIRETQELLERVEQQERVSRAGLHALRVVGDGVAWKALEYDRRAIGILGRGRRVGRLADGTGRDAEMLELGRLWTDEGVFALHNDLTNCIRHGDLTVIRRDGGALQVTLAEVKAGRGSNSGPQLKRLEHATALLQSGRSLTDGKTVEVTIVPTAYRTYLGALPALLAEARLTGFAWARPHDCLLVGAVDYRVLGADADDYIQRSTAERARIGWEADAPDTVAWASVLRRIRDRVDGPSALAPYTIFPISADDAADLVLGFMDVFVNLDLDRLERVLRHDLDVDVARGPALESLFLEVTEGDTVIRVPPYVREQMMVELMTPETLYAAIRHVLDLDANRQHAPDSRLVTFEHEATTWDDDLGRLGA